MFEIFVSLMVQRPRLLQQVLKSVKRLFTNVIKVLSFYPNAKDWEDFLLLFSSEPD